MLKVITDNETIIMDYDKYFITEKYIGIDEIGFTLPIDHPNYKQISEEALIEEKQRYLIKAIDEGKETVNIKGELDLDELKADMFINYTNGSNTVVQTITGILPAGWTVDDQAHITIRRTIETDGGTPLDIIDACRSVYGVTTRFDNISRVVSIIEPTQNQPAGVYMTDKLNLTEVNFKGSSNNFATRLYAYGQNGLSFESINDGKPYVEDFTYSNKIVSAYWSDERYTILENLLEDAKKNLAKMAIPQRSYQCNVIDLAKVTESDKGANENIYSFLDFSLYNVVILFDTRRNTRINHMVVEYKRYPYYPESNVVTLSTITPKIQSTVKTIQSQIENSTSDFRSQLRASIDTATQLITGSLGGHYIVTTDSVTGEPNGWAVLIDSDNIEAVTKVWRMTAGGLGYSSTGWNGPYGLAMTSDGEIVADFISTGVLSAVRIQSDDGTTSWDLGTGICSLNGTFKTTDDNKTLTLTGGSMLYAIDGQDVFRINNQDGTRGSEVRLTNTSGQNTMYLWGNNGQVQAAMFTVKRRDGNIARNVIQMDNADNAHVQTQYINNRSISWYQGSDGRYYLVGV